MGAAAAITGAVAALATTAFSVKSSNDARNQAQQDAVDQQAQATKLQQDQEDQTKAAQQQQANVQINAVQQQKNRAAAAQGTFGGTLLTGPMGVQGSTGGGSGKTLLGS